MREYRFQTSRRRTRATVQGTKEKSPSGCLKVLDLFSGLAGVSPAPPTGRAFSVVGEMFKPVGVTLLKDNAGYYQFMRIYDC